MVAAAAGTITGMMESQRKKPLRTYSKKRSLSTPEDGEAQASDKRRKTFSMTRPAPTAAADPTEAPELPRLPAPPSSSFEKGSILNYFKPCRSSSTDSTMMKKLATSSPQMALDGRPHKAPRRLQLRPPTPLVTSCGDDENDGSDSSCNPRRPGTDGHLRDGRETLSGVSGGSGTDGSAYTPISQPPVPGGGASCLEISKPTKKPTRAKSAPVQTTINLSTKSTFEECKICQIVYNPLHPPDVKFHTKQHKAILRGLTRG